jgi:hypothetical protein
MGQNKDLDARLLQMAASCSPGPARDALKGGADPQARDAQGRTGMHIAINHSEYPYNNRGRELVSMFLNRGLDINTKDGAGATILHHATQDESYNICIKLRDLLSFGGDIEARDNDGRTPLHWAVQKGYKTDGVKYLLEAGAQVNARDEAGATPLHLAARRGDADVIRALIAAGADIHAEARDGRKVWDYAVEGGQDYQAQSLKAEAYASLRAAEKQRQQEQERKREAEKPRDPWTLLGPEKVAHSSVERQIGYKLTEVFNFAARTYTQITHNLSTKSDAVAVKTFDEFDDKTPLERAFVHLERLGGQSDRATISGPVVEKPRKGLKFPNA